LNGNKEDKEITEPVRSIELLSAVLASLYGERSPVIITGPIGAGKTTAALRLAAALKVRGVNVGGIVAPRLTDRGKTVGYRIVDLSNGAEHRFASLKPPGIPVGRFFVDGGGLDFARQALSRAERMEVAFVDEVGRMELRGDGHAGAIRRLLAADALPVLTVRDEFLDRAITAFSLERASVFRVSLPLEKRRNEPKSGTEEALWKIVDTIGFPILITKGKDGFPHVRPMRLLEREGTSFWFATSAGSAKVEEIEADPRVGLLFVDTQRFNYAIVRGNARLVRDPDREVRLWEEDWCEDWPEGPTDPDYSLLLIEGREGSYHRGLTGESGEVTLDPG